MPGAASKSTPASTSSSTTEPLCGVDACVRQPQGFFGTRVGGAPAVTLQDAADFLPAAAALHCEPNGWAVVGVPANCWVSVKATTVAGEVLDQAVDVRFTPVSYRFDYGDGATVVSATPGASWADLGQEELTETATSHVFTERGARAATATVSYTASYRFTGEGWVDITGTVTGSTSPVPVLVVTERTALTPG